MPLGFERLNERSQRPNALINFIKALKGPDKAVAEDYLNRIAAQCYPVMKAAHISVMTLEEFPPNKEFLGRNFNAGECIQLVLKNKSGQWLGFKFVQMVMMHELAHCKQMNHSRYFWQVRNQYAEQMSGLWAKKYLGEGVWGRGQDLTTGGFVMDRDMQDGEVPQHLCGGTYRRRGRKRRRGAQNNDGQRPTYAERQQRRIAKKFGKHGDGNALGEDELVRGALEQAHRHQGKPRVANSKRGRELRAQAALARFAAAQTSLSAAPAIRPAEEDDSDIEWSDSDGDDAEEADENGFIQVCGKEDEEDGDANNEMDELRAITNGKSKADKTIKNNKTVNDNDKTDKNNEDLSSTNLTTSSTGNGTNAGQNNSGGHHTTSITQRKRSQSSSTTESEASVVNDIEGGKYKPLTTRQKRSISQDTTESEASVIMLEDTIVDKKFPASGTASALSTLPASTSNASTAIEPPVTSALPASTSNSFTAIEPSAPPAPPASISTTPCPICSLENEQHALLCMACAHVLRPRLVARSWHCKSEVCRGTAYLNAGDVGRCGICGSSKPTPSAESVNGGAISVDVLRWD